MKQFLVFIATIGAAYAGLGTLTQSEEAQVYSEFMAKCINGRAPETGLIVEGGITLYCKQSDGHSTKTTSTKKDIVVQGGLQRVFVKPPRLDLTHNILLKTILEATKANVYAVPGEVQHKYNVVTEPTTRAKKPTVFYLGSSGPNPVDY